MAKENVGTTLGFILVNTKSSNKKIVNVKLNFQLFFLWNNGQFGL